MDQPPDIRLFHASGILDAEGVCEAPGSLLIEESGQSVRVLASGSHSQVHGHPSAERAQVVDCQGAVLIPGLVNAHTHLDLTHVGPQPYDPVRGRFGDWLAMVLRERATTDEAIRDSVRQGIDRSMAGGVVAVGDIAGVWSTVPTETLRQSPIGGVSYVECFGMGQRQKDSFIRLVPILESIKKSDRGVRVGVSPHAPYTVGLQLYDLIYSHSQSMGYPLATHLAESEPEHKFIAKGEGLFRDLLESMGLWDDSILDNLGDGNSPITYFFQNLGRRISHLSRDAPSLFVHCNDVDDLELDLLAGSNASVAYCPRSSSYFGAHHRFGPHKYAEMIKRGINVALGTDSIINLPRDASGGAPTISTLDEMRFLYARDGDSGGRVPPRALLAMATTNGARALGLDAERYTFSPGLIEGVVSVGVGEFGGSDSLAEALVCSSEEPMLLTHRAPTP